MNEYLSNYPTFAQSGIGYTQYQSNLQSFRKFTRQVKKYHAVFSLYASHLYRKRANLPRDTINFHHCVVFQDLQPNSDLLNVIETLMNQVLAPFRALHKPVSLFSLYPKKDYKLAITSGYLHKDLRAHSALLMVEALNDLASRNVPSVNSACSHRFKVESHARFFINAGPDNDLDENQLTAVRHIHGPIRVLAPAGSGKTKTLTNRIIHLIHAGLNPDQILALAFNKKAADEMCDRLTIRGIPVAQRLAQHGATVRTFHGLGYEIVRKKLHWDFDMAKAPDLAKNIMQQVASEFSIPITRTPEFLDSLVYDIRRVKTELLQMDEMQVELEDRLIVFKDIFERFSEIQEEKKMLTFDDMIYLAVKVLSDDFRMRQRLQSRFQFILVDEFQDLNRAQITFMQILALPDNNLFVVGDDDQMIYGWRGADVEHMLQFIEKYKSAKDCILTTNYRSTKTIVQHAKWLIGHNRHRVYKNMQPSHKAGIGFLNVCFGDSLWRQAQFTVDWIKERKKLEKGKYIDFAVLVRYHAHQYIISLLLEGAGIPHTAVAGETLFQTSVAKDVYSYLTVILFDQTAEKKHFSRILRRPFKYLSNTIIEKIHTWEDLIYIEKRVIVNSWDLPILRNFTQKLFDLKKMAKRNSRPYEFVSQMARSLNLWHYYQNRAQLYAAPDEAGYEVLLEVFVNVVQSFSSLAELYHNLQKSLEAPVKLEQKEIKNTTGVELATIHATKGKEFKNVIIFNLAKDQKQTAILESEEERRVFYVGVTRATDNLLITAPRGNYSPFLPELLLDPKLAALSDKRLQRRLEKVRRKRTPIEQEQRLEKELYYRELLQIKDSKCSD